MKKKDLKSIFVVAAMTLCVGNGWRAYMRYVPESDEYSSLLMENVEALSQETDESAKKEKTCGTKVKRIDDRIECPECHAKDGFLGYEYSCQSKGTDKKCKKGSVGVETSCNTRHDLRKEINDVKEYDC